MRKSLLLYMVLLAVALLAGSCRRAVEKARENIKIEAVEKVERIGLTGANLTMRVRNDTNYKLQLDRAQLGVFYADARVVTVVLRDPVVVERQAVQSVTTTWQLKVSDPLALYVLLRKLDKDEMDQIFVSYMVEGRGGPMPVNLSREMQPLSEFLNTFGVTLQDVKNYLTK